MIKNGNSNFFKNPLGVIGIFLVLTEAIASFVITKSNLIEYQNNILIAFIVIFPFIVLIVFYDLVTKHHEKLYSPSDFKDEKNFVSTYNSYTQTSEISESSNIDMEQNARLNTIENEISVSNENFLNLMKYIKQFLDNSNHLSINDSDKDYFREIQTKNMEMTNAYIEPTIYVSNTKESNHLVNMLRNSGYDAHIYYKNFSRTTQPLLISQEAIWLGKNVPVEIAINVIRIAKEHYSHLKYIEVSGNHGEPNYVKYQIFIGGATTTATDRHLKPLKNSDFEQLYKITDLQILHNFINQFKEIS